MRGLDYTNFVTLYLIFFMVRTLACPKKIEIEVRYSRDCPLCPECMDTNSKYYNEMWCITPLCTKMKISPSFCNLDGIAALTYMGQCGALKCNNNQVSHDKKIIHDFHTGFTFLANTVP